MQIIMPLLHDWNPFTMQYENKKSKFHGIESEGMMCGGRELRLNTCHTELLILRQIMR
jgi:tRNA-binding EMAP/Myf-like protein